MTYKIIENATGFMPIANTDTGYTTIPSSGSATGPTPPMTLGMIVKAVDPVYGAGEFILLKGVASTVAGSVVVWSGVNSTANQTYQTALAPATANLAQPLAVAMSANLAATWGWYQISGNAVVATNGTLAAGPAPVYLAGAGQLTSTPAAGKQVENAINVSATGTPSAGFAIVNIDRPFAQGSIT